MLSGLVLVAVIGKGAEEPPALCPRRLHLKGLLIELDGLLDVIGLARGGSLRGQVLKGTCRSRQTGNRKHEYSGQNLHFKAFQSHYNTPRASIVKAHVAGPGHSDISPHAHAWRFR